MLNKFDRVNDDGTSTVDCMPRSTDNSAKEVKEVRRNLALSFSCSSGNFLGLFDPFCKFAVLFLDEGIMAVQGLKKNRDKSLIF